MRTDALKIGRNDPCPCGSGRKYKHCCFQRDLRGTGKRASGNSVRGLLEAAMQYEQEGQLLSAGACYRQVIEAQPALAGAHYNLGNILQAQGEFEEAVQSYRRTLEIEPRWAEAYCNLGSALKDLGRLDEAISAYRSALSERSNDVLAHYNLGNLLKDQGRPVEAVASYRQALALKPDFEDGYANLMLLLRKLGRFDEAAQCIRAWIALHPDLIRPYASLADVLSDQGRIAEAFETYSSACAARPESAEARSWPIFLSAYCGLHNPAEYLSMARGWEIAVIPAEERNEARRRRFRRDSLAGRRLRVGYVSGDFWLHAVSFFLPQLLQHHDRERVEVFAYSTSDASDPTTERIRGLAGHWAVVSSLGDSDLRARIEVDGIDVLVDLSGHTAYNRLGAFARRAAPVQAHYLGYFASTGLTEMDYWIGDEVLTPASADAEFSERLWRLPRTWVSYDGRPEAPEASWRPTTDGSVWLGSFNDIKKLTPATVALWSRVLHALPEGRLLLKTRALCDEGNRQRVRGAFEAQGIAPERLELLDISGTVGWSAHMASYDRLDIALDPVGAVGGGTTTCDALWMGVPLVSLAGGRAASRMTASMLCAIGRPEWLAQSEDQYITITVALARDVALRGSLRGAQRARMAASPLCDARDLAARLEEAYVAMFERWQAAQ